MDLVLELASEPVLQKIAEKVVDIKVDVNEVVQTTALTVLNEIKKIIGDESKDEFEKIENIVRVFENYNIDTNGCCDYRCKKSPIQGDFLHQLFIFHHSLNKVSTAVSVFTLLAPEMYFDVSPKRIFPSFTG